MGRRSSNRTKQLQYNVEDRFTDYASWNYVSRLPAYDSSLFDLFIKVYGADLAIQKKFTKSTASRYLFHHVKYHTKEYYELERDFPKYFEDNPWMKDYYKFCFERSTFVYHPFDFEFHYINISENQKNISPEREEEVKKIRNYFSEDIDFRRFHLLHNMLSLETYNELKRDVPFVVGNIVRLRTRYINSRGHDPFWAEPKEIREEERVGHIVSFLNETHSSSYNGKGSRLVEVYWQATGKIRKQSIASLKLFDQKNNKMIDKIVEE